MTNWGITTSKAKPLLLERAKQISREMGIPLLRRGKQSLAHLQEAYELDYLFVLEHEDLVVYHEAGELFFHPNMAIPRIKVLSQGQQDSMLMAMDLQVGDQVLDCTLGLASDALVASYLVGESGLVLGLESSEVIYLITRYGLAHCEKGSQLVQEAMRKIRIQLGDYKTILPRMADNSYDVVYFDPMFDKALVRSSGIAGLREAANYAPLTEADLHEAKRVARKRVVVKHRKGSMDPKLFDQMQGGKYSAIAFGVLGER